MITNITRFFPESVARLVTQNGAVLEQAPPGVTVILTLRNDMPVSAEIFSTDLELYADMGLEFEGNTLTGYDGVFDLPSEVITMVKELGFKSEI